MKARTLVTQRSYYGMDPLSLRAATARVFARVVGLPAERARVSARNLHQDFGVGDAAAVYFGVQQLHSHRTWVQD